MKRAMLAAALIPLPAAQVMYKVDLARTGYSPARLGAPVELAWKAEAGGEFYSSAAIDGETAYLGNSDRHLYAYSIKDGALKWKSKLSERVYGASPQLEGGRLYITTVDACVHALDTATGAVFHSTCLPEAGFFESSNAVLGSVLVLGPKYFFGSDNGRFYSWTAGAGQPDWTASTGERIHDCSPAYDGTSIYATSGDGSVYAFESETGKITWKSKEIGALINSTPAVQDGRVFAGAKDGKLRAYGSSTGEILWEFDTGKAVMSSPALDSRRKALVFGSADGHVYCLTQAEGRLLWKFKTGGMVLGTPLITADTAWIGSYDEFFYALSMDGGAELFRHEAKGGVFAAPAASGRCILVGTRKGSLLAFSATPSK